ncbi:unnamed protein product, partial [Rotaria magnacalcarata]
GHSPSHGMSRGMKTTNHLGLTPTLGMPSEMTTTTI